MGLRDGEVETAAEMASALRNSDVSAMELVDRSLRRALEWQPFTNAFSQLWAEEALDQARRIDEMPVDGRPLLAGIPLAVKDLFDVDGHETTGCCAAYKGNVARSDAPIIGAVRRAGAVMIGKTNMHELAAGGTNLVSACGRTGNPWDPDRMTGGSSGGSGAAVVAGIVPLALGSDTGGSIRIPASMCGAFGLKPTTGRHPLQGILPLAPSLDCPGPMAGTAADLRLLYQAFGGAPSLPGADPAEIRLGLPGGSFADRVHQETLAVVRAVAAKFEEAGMAVGRVDGAGLDDARRAWMRVCTPEFAAAHAGVDRALVHPSVVEWMEYGESLSERERIEAAVRRREIRSWYLERLEDFEVLLIPTTPYPAPGADQATVDLGPAGMVKIDDVGPGWITCSVNLAGLPAVNLPAGRSADGLPIGVSLVGREDGEDTLLGLASRWETAAGYRPERPALPA